MLIAILWSLFVVKNYLYEKFASEKTCWATEIFRLKNYATVQTSEKLFINQVNPITG